MDGWWMSRALMDGWMGGEWVVDGLLLFFFKFNIYFFIFLFF